MFLIQNRCQLGAASLVAQVLLVLPLLDKGPEGRQASPQARHVDGRGLVLRDLHDGMGGVGHADRAGPLKFHQVS